MWARGEKRLGAVFDTWKKYTNPKCKYLNIKIRVQCAFFSAVGNVTSHCYGCHCHHKNKRSSKLYTECLNCREDFCHNLSFYLYCASSGSWELNVKPQYKLFPFCCSLCFVINSLIQHLHMSASTSLINQQSTNYSKKKTKTTKNPVHWTLYGYFGVWQNTNAFLKWKLLRCGKHLKNRTQREKNVHRQLEKTTFIRIGWVSFNVNVKRKRVFFTNQHWTLKPMALNAK